VAFRVRAIAGALVEGLWLHPSVGLLAGVGLALAAPTVAGWLPPDSLGVLRPAPDLLRPGLKALGGVAVTLLTVTLSVLMVVLQSVATQYSPRLVRHVLRSQVGQATVAAFAAAVGLSATGLLVLARTPAPRLEAVIGAEAAALAAVDLFALIYFVHYFTFSLQAPNVAHRIHHAVVRALERERRRGNVPPDASGRPEVLASWPTGRGRVATALDAEYVQACAATALLRIAARHDLYVQAYAAPGHFVSDQARLVEVWPPERATARRLRALRRAFFLANDRRITTDPLYGLDLLAEIALRALSPDHNDLVTAETCARYAGDILVRLARAPAPPATLRDRSGAPRVRLVARTFEDVLRGAVSDLARVAARYHPPVLEVVLEVVRAAGAAAEAQHRRAAAESLADELAGLRPASPRSTVGPQREAARRWPVEAASRGRRAAVPTFASLRRAARQHGAAPERGGERPPGVASGRSA